MAITFGRVAHPGYSDRPISKPEGKGQNDLGQRTVKGVVLHRILGGLWGTDTYFRRADVNALTDYGVGVTGQDGEARDGEILRWNDPLGRQSGWASGVVSAPYGDGLAFVNKYGVNAVNRDQASIEISGFQTTPLSPVAFEEIAKLMAYWGDQYGIPWDVWPISPKDGFSFVRWHQEFTIGTGKLCPFSVVMGQTSALIERSRAILKAAQEEPVTPPAPPKPLYATPDVPDWFEASLLERVGTDTKVDGVTWHAVRRNMSALKNANRYSSPDTASPKSGPKVLVRDKVAIERYFTDAAGRRWLVEDGGHFLTAASFSPRLSIKAA